MAAGRGGGGVTPIPSAAARYATTWGPAVETACTTGSHCHCGQAATELKALILSRKANYCTEIPAGIHTSAELQVTHKTLPP
jgi:hypothetical protein